ncbi:unnamed protein product [Rotaria sp. Silwood1]|nr:unnamed protein product [Rotaria sp. Silwood1]
MLINSNYLFCLLFSWLSPLIPLLYYILLIILIVVNQLPKEKLLFCLLYILCRTHNCLIIIVHMIYYFNLNENDAHLLFLFSQSSFYHLGNSNSFVTIDISSGFVGIPIYIPIIHGIFIYLSTYGLSIVWLFKLSKSELIYYLIEITLINNTALSVGNIIGIVIGIIAAIATVIFLIIMIYYCCKNKNRNDVWAESSPPPPYNYYNRSYQQPINTTYYN